MDAEERVEFESNSRFHDAVQLGHWDNMAKASGLNVPGLEHHRAGLEAAMTVASISRT
jgi:predicted HD phosphohydrolase